MVSQIPKLDMGHLEYRIANQEGIHLWLWSLNAAHYPPLKGRC